MIGARGYGGVETAPVRATPIGDMRQARGGSHLPGGNPTIVAPAKSGGNAAETA
jgi:hypothetical protein